MCTSIIINYKLNCLEFEVTLNFKIAQNIHNLIIEGLSNNILMLSALHDATLIDVNFNLLITVLNKPKDFLCTVPEQLTVWYILMLIRLNFSFFKRL